MTQQKSPAQSPDTYTDQLYFGMLSYNPDTAIIEFVASHVPSVLKKAPADGKWVAYPPGVFKEPVFYTVTQVYHFNSHPYFDTYFNTGKLAITQKVYKNEQWPDNITEMMLWFEFDKKEDAQKSFRQLVAKFKGFNVREKITSRQGIKKAAFTDDKSDRYYKSVQIVLVTDYALGKSYIEPGETEVKTIFEPGYKLIVEIGNDLY